MKKYTKPMLMTLSVSADDMLCSGCGAGAIKGTPEGEFLTIYFDRNKDGRLDWDKDFGETLFSPEDGCTDTDPMLEAYCKHTAGNIILWS